MKSFLFSVAIFGLLASCSNPSTKQSASKTDSTQTQAQAVNHPAPVEKVLTKDERDKLTPDTVLQMLKDGNNRFVSDKLTDRLYSSQVKATADGQYPMAVVLSCLDSRIPVETVFDQGIGDLFVARVAGNIVDEDILGSMEFGCKASGSKLILVLGHTNCGAIKGAIDNVQLGNLTALLKKIKPAIDSSKSFNGDKTSKNHDYVDEVCKKNVELTVNAIRKQSPVLRDMEKDGEIKIVGAVYDLSTGKVTFM